MSRKKVVLLTSAGCALLVLALGVVAFLMLRNPAEKIEVKDSIYGKIRGRHLLIDGINHGVLALNEGSGEPDKNYHRLATSYYHRRGPLGVVLERYNWLPGPDHSYWADVRMPASFLAACANAGNVPLPCAARLSCWGEPPIGAIFLSTGTPAVYLRPGQMMDFYEPNPAITELSLPSDGKPPAFPFLQDALKRGAHVRVLPGPARQTLAEKGPEHFYQVLIVETSHGHSDFPSPEPLTKEALALYLSKVTHDGVICFHTSSRIYDLMRVVAALATDAGCAYQVGDHSRPGAKPLHLTDPLFFTSEWVMVVRDARHIGKLRNHPESGLEWNVPVSAPRFLCTDQVNNLPAARRER